MSEIHSPNVLIEIQEEKGRRQQVKIDKNRGAELCSITKERKDQK